jgi:hypothetical protein
MSGIDGDKPLEKSDKAPLAPSEVVVYSPPISNQEPTIQIVTSRRISSGRMSFESVQRISFAKLSVWLILLGTLTAGALGFILGAVLGALEIARISALVGALFLGGVTGLLALRVGLSAQNAGSGLIQRLGGAFVVAIFCGAIGGLAGAVVVAFAGILCGAIAGSVLGALVKRGPAGIGSGFLLGSLLGPLVLALYLDREKALEWGTHGAWIAAAACLVLLSLGGISARAKLRKAGSIQTP